MNPLNCKNLVAKILQVYAWLNAVSGIILAIFIASEMSGIIAFIFGALVIVVSFFIYALGEIIELLDQIKLNTSGNQQIEANEELPEL